MTTVTLELAFARRVCMRNLIKYNGKNIYTEMIRRALGKTLDIQWENYCKQVLYSATCLTGLESAE